MQESTPTICKSATVSYNNGKKRHTNTLLNMTVACHYFPFLYETVTDLRIVGVESSTIFNIKIIKYIKLLLIYFLIL